MMFLDAGARLFEGFSRLSSLRADASAAKTSRRPTTPSPPTSSRPKAIRLPSGSAGSRGYPELLKPGFKCFLSISNVCFIRSPYHSTFLPLLDDTTLHIPRREKPTCSPDCRMVPEQHTLMTLVPHPQSLSKSSTLEAPPLLPILMYPAHKP